MHFNPSMGDNELEGAITRALEIGTPNGWQHNIDRLKAESQGNPFAPYYFSERYSLELAMEYVRTHRRNTGRMPDALRADAKTHRLFAFAAMLASVYDRLPKHSKRVIAGRTRGGLTDDAGLWPLAFELVIASHLMQKGVDVEWHDLNTEGFDFLARRGDAIAEVECKTFSADIGRKIHKKRHYQLGGLIHREMSAAIEKRGSFFLDVQVEDRLSGHIIEDTAEEIRRALTSGSSVAGLSPCSVTVHWLSPSDLPFNPNLRDVSEDEVKGFIEKRFNLFNPSLLVLGRPRLGIAILATRSAKADHVVDGMYKQLKHGSRQFTGNHPAILCAHFLDLAPSELVNLHAAQEKGEPSGLNLIVTRLFKNSRPFLHTVQFTAPGLLQEFQTVQGDIRRHHVMESGSSFVFVNRDHPLADAPGQQLLS